MFIKLSASPRLFAASVISTNLALTTTQGHSESRLTTALLPVDTQKHHSCLNDGLLQSTQGHTILFHYEYAA